MIRTVPLLLVAAAPALAQAPPGYYASVDTTSGAALRATLHDVIDDHVRIPYTSFGTDTWDVLEAAQQDPNDPTRVLDVYRNASFPKQGGGNALYQREHTWPRSYGFPVDDGMNLPFTDCHMLMLCDGGYNGARSNLPFGACNAGCNEYPTEVNQGQGGGSGSFPGNSNWSSGSFTSGTWQVWPGRRGDVARALLYSAVRYEGGAHAFTGASEPDLELTDDLGLLASSNTGQNETFGYMGRLSVLLQWHEDDPVDAFEERRNDVVASFQGNRNPFVDYPEWVACVFLDDCGLGERYCSPGVANSTGQPGEIEARGSAVIADDDFRLLASNLPNHAAGFFLCSRTAGIVFQPGGSQGNLCLAGDIGRGVGGVILNTGFFGSFATGVDLQDLPQPAGNVAVLPGETWRFQAWYRDSVGGAATSNLTDGWEVTFR